MKTTGFAFFACLLAVLAIVGVSCSDDGDLKGHLTLSVTDSPIDATNVEGVNIYFTDVEAKVGSEWKSLHRFEQPVGINLLAYTGGRSYPVINQPLDPGTITTLRFTLNLAQTNTGFVRNPQCNVFFQDGTTKPLYSFDGTTEVLVEQTMNIQTRTPTDFTFDFDVRKSLTINEEGNFVFKPVIRVIETSKAGHISSPVKNYNPVDNVVVFAYTPGTYNASEIATPAAGEVRFSHAINSAHIVDSKVAIGFLEAGNYDLVFAKHDTNGEFINVLGHLQVAGVVAGETLQDELDMAELGGS